jgi:subtilisin family serine protease
MQKKHKQSARTMCVCLSPLFVAAAGTECRFLFATLMLATISFTTPLLHAQASASAALAKIEPHLAAVIAPGGNSEALIIMSEQADLSGADSLPTKLEKGQYVYSKLREVAERTQAPLRNRLDQMGIPYESFYSVNMIKVNASRDQLYELAGHDEVGRVEANPRVKSGNVPTSGALSILATLNVSTPTTTGITWNISQINAPQVWSRGINGRGVVVASADTGVMWNHPALQSHYRGWNGSSVNHNYNWFDGTSAHSATPVDPQSHGTFTTSEMVGDDGHGNQVGVAPGAKWIACRNMDASGVGSPASYTACFDWLLAPYPTGHPAQANPALAPDIINNSWDCPPSEGCSVNTLLAIVNAVRASGIFVTVAAGNSGPGCSTVNMPPAIYASSVSVGATDSGNLIARFSSRGAVTADGSGRLKPDLVAPGQYITGAIPNSPWYQSYWSGTSMAAPEVSGAVALLWQAKPGLVGNISRTLSYLTQNATHLTSTQSCGSFRGSSVPNAVFGYGLLNILRAVQAP